MTIDQYLNQGEKLKDKADDARRKLEIIESRTINQRSSSNYGDGVPGGHTNVNRTEDRMIDYLEAGRAFIAAQDEYKQFQEQLRQASYNLLHWEALVIEQIYIINPYYGHDDLYRIDEILNTKFKGRIMEKVTIAKGHLAEQLRTIGIEIDQ